MKDYYVADKASLVPQRRPPPSSVFLYGIFGEKILLPFFKVFMVAERNITVWNLLEMIRYMPTATE